MLLHPATSSGASGKTWFRCCPRTTRFTRRPSSATARRATSAAACSDADRCYRPPPSATSMSLAWTGLTSRVIPWVAVWPSSWLLGGERRPSALFRRLVSGQTTTDQRLGFSGTFELGGKVIRLIHPVAPLVLKSAAGRRIILHNFVCHGERLSAARALDFVLCRSHGLHHHVRPFGIGRRGRAAGPTAMPHHSRMGRSGSNCCGGEIRRTARVRLPGATWVTLPGVGHNPMVDDPNLGVGPSWP